MKKAKQTKGATAGCAPVTGSPCECLSWCRDGSDWNSPHHPKCPHYEAPAPDPRLAVFGRLMWKYITDLGGDFCINEISEDILPLAEQAGLCRQVQYDPEKHGGGIEADPSDVIWHWGDAVNDQADRSL